MPVKTVGNLPCTGLIPEITNDSPDEESVRHASEADEENDDDKSETWETESVLADVIEDLSDNRVFIEDPQACTLDEAIRYRSSLRELGLRLFWDQMVGAGSVSAKKLLTAFQVHPPPFLQDEPDEAYHKILWEALRRDLQTRARLTQYSTVDDAINLLKKSRNIIVLTGAGISTSLGIPDFRSAGHGLYAKLARLGLSDPQEVFDLQTFIEDPSIFYSFAREILPTTDAVSPTHAFIALLQEKGKLLTNYSQNVDNLETKAGIKRERLIQCHGSFASASCVKCAHKVPGETIVPYIRAGKVPRCRQCRGINPGKRRNTANNQKCCAKRKHPHHGIVNEPTQIDIGASKRPRRRNANYASSKLNSGLGQLPHTAPDISKGEDFTFSRDNGNGHHHHLDDLAEHYDDDEDYGDNQSAPGAMKPDITFFGEELPAEFGRRLREHDCNRVDLVLIIGTSLKVKPVSEIIPFLPPLVPQIYISRTPINNISFDLELLGECDVVVAELCRQMGWDLKHPMIPPNQGVIVEAARDAPGRHNFHIDE